MQCAGGELPATMPTTDPVCQLQARYAPMCNSGMTTIEIANHLWLHLTHIPQEGIHVWDYEPGQKPKSGKVIGCSGEAPVVLLSGHIIAF